MTGLVDIRMFPHTGKVVSSLLGLVELECHSMAFVFRKTASLSQGISPVCIPGLSLTNYTTFPN